MACAHGTKWDVLVAPNPGHRPVHRAVKSLLLQLRRYIFTRTVNVGTKDMLMSLSRL